MVRNKDKIKRKALLLAFYWNSALPPQKTVQQMGNGVWYYSKTAPLCSSLFLRLSLWSGVGCPWALASFRTYPPALAWGPSQAAICSITVHVLWKQQPTSTWSCQNIAKRLSALVPGVPPHLFLLLIKILINFLDEHIHYTNTGTSCMGKKIAAHWL